MKDSLDGIFFEIRKSLKEAREACDQVDASERGGWLAQCEDLEAAIDVALRKQQAMAAKLLERIQTRIELSTHEPWGGDKII